MTEPPKQPERDDKMSSEDYENLLDRYQFSTKEITMGKVLKGRVIKRTPTHVLVDIGFKTEGIIPNEDFTTDQDRRGIRPSHRQIRPEKGRVALRETRGRCLVRGLETATVSNRNVMGRQQAFKGRGKQHGPMPTTHALITPPTRSTRSAVTPSNQ